jgi:alpha-beta hydrolase superfamily lysophospholipase
VERSAWATDKANTPGVTIIAQAFVRGFVFLAFDWRSRALRRPAGHAPSLDILLDDFGRLLASRQRDRVSPTVP